MTTYPEFTEQLGARILDALRPVEDAVAQAVQAADGVVAKLPPLDLPFVGDRLAQLPTAETVVTANFDLVERLVAAQRAFALRLVSASQESARVFVPAQATSPEDARLGAGV